MKKPTLDDFITFMILILMLATMYSFREHLDLMPFIKKGP